MKNKLAVLLVNLGTPSAPTASAVRAYLREFLSDPLVVDLPKTLWSLILNLLILPLRSPKVAKKYQEIWLPGGSPLRFYTEQLAEKLQQILQVPVIAAMRYGQGNIKEALQQLNLAELENLIIVPLFPQYSSTTTASIVQQLDELLKTNTTLPRIKFIDDYHMQADYIEALAESVRRHRSLKGEKQQLVILFHGIPQSCIKKGDPYQRQCEMTALLLAERLKLKPEEWTLAYQSRFGKAKWLQPYAAEVFAQLPKKGIISIDVISPGFPVDCLETLEEIALQYQATFFEAGGQKYDYIPALNASDLQLHFFSKLIKDHYDFVL